MSFLEDLRARARARSATLVFPEGGDPRVQQAALALAADGLARPVLFGAPADLLQPRGGESGTALRLIDPSEYTSADTGRSQEGRTSGAGSQAPARRAVAVDPLAIAAEMVASGEADGLVAGAVRTTADVVRATLRHVGLREGVRTLSSAFYMLVPPFRSDEGEVLTFTDAGVVPDPDPRQLAEIAVSAAEARRALVGDEPRVAFLSYSTRGSAEGPGVTKMREALAVAREMRPDLIADGELQGDAALIERVAQSKAPGSPVAGRANILVFPDLAAANIAYKLVQRLAGATALGPILQGARRPCNDLSRGATAEDIRNVACITAVLS